MKANFQESNQSFTATFESSTGNEKTFSATMKEVVEVATNDHRRLAYKDAPDQHPMTAIKGLVAELDSKVSEAMTNLEIEELLK